MKVVDLHPEELIDKLAAGELSSAERERLDDHLARCPSCRFEIQVRADLEQDALVCEERPQLTFASAQLSARTRPVGPPLAARAARVSASLRARSRRRWPQVMLAAAFVLCAGGATAAVLAGAVRAPWQNWAPDSKASAGSQQAAHRAPHPAKRVATKVVAPNASSEAAPSAANSTASVAQVPPVTAALAPSAQVSSPRSSSSANSRELASRRPLAPGSAEGPARAAFPAPSAAAAEPPANRPARDEALAANPAAALFADANRARRDGNADRAAMLYRALQSRYPSSPESEVSRALLAQLLLDRGSPEAALAGFDRYLAAGAPALGAEALVGRARALEQLGQPLQAAAAWQEVQSRFPGSVHARLAATRRAALGMR